MIGWQTERFKVCHVEEIGDEKKYYVIVQNEKVEVTRGVYDVIEHSYHKEWNMQYGFEKSRKVSLDQICENIEKDDCHGTIPDSLMCCSPETMFFERLNQAECCHRVDNMLSQLSEDKQSLLWSFVENNGAIRTLSKKRGVSNKAVYRERERLRKRVERRFQEESSNE